MEKKKRKLSKEELDLWKVVTKNDNRYKDYSDDVDTINSVKKKVNKTNIIKPKNIENITIKKSISLDSIQVNRRMKEKLERGIIRPEAKLDLHGNNQIEAKKALIEFITSSIQSGKRCILIITGKKNTYHGAKGVLRAKLPVWLKDNSLADKVLSHSYATYKDGGDGARYVLLRKQQKVQTC